MNSPAGGDPGRGRWTEYLLPGLVDLQVNGWAGIDFNASDLDSGQVEAAVAGLARTGTLTFLAAVVTNRPDLMLKSMETLAAAKSCGAVRRALAGIHLEGPFISPEAGARGAHPAEYILPPDVGLLNELWEASAGLLKMLTFAPELPGADALLDFCAGKGIIPAIGHSHASIAAVQAAIRGGARLSTHLGNGCAELLPRHPNHLWAQLAEDALTPTMIADGHHLPDEVMRVFLKAKGGKVVLVSDVTSFGGLPPGEYEAHIGGKVVLDSEGRLFMAAEPALLAGAALPLSAGVFRLARRGVLSLKEAWRLASDLPAAVLGMRTAPGSVHVVESSDGNFRVAGAERG
jgi:N-acetylglucosamine-6-phosphate deacetylase